MYVLGLSKENLGFPPVFAMQTFQQLNFTGMILYRKGISSLPTAVGTEC